jgi:hypothetical protein
MLPSSEYNNSQDKKDREGLNDRASSAKKVRSSPVRDGSEAFLFLRFEYSIYST